MGTRAAAGATRPQGEEPKGSRLVVGADIKLKGVEITDCDTLVVAVKERPRFDDVAVFDKRSPGLADAALDQPLRQSDNPLISA